jgi:hypothetical protein
MTQPPDYDETELSPERIKATKKQARKWFIILVTVGLIIGALASVAVVTVLDTFGLTDKPEQPFMEQMQK